MIDGQKAVNAWNYTICIIMTIIFIHDVYKNKKIYKTNLCLSYR